MFPKYGFGEKMLISIITVCFNCEEQIKKTLDSVLLQTFKDFEYVVIDGASRDSTYSIVKTYLPKFERLLLFSEPDQGIYDAMNKGIQKAQGDYLYFLNAGDYFYGNDVLQRIAEKLSSGKEIYYGQIIRGSQTESYPDTLNLYWLIYCERMICHQAIFAKRELYLNYPYNLRYKICADRDWLLQALKSGALYEYINDIIICYYDINGASSHYEAFSTESLKLAEEYIGLRAVVFIKLKRCIGLMMGHHRNKIQKTG